MIAGDPAPDLTEGEARLLGGDGNVARGDEAVAATGDMALHTSDERFGVVEHRDEHVDEAARAAGGEAAAGRGHRACKVRTGAEGRAASGEHHDTHVGVLGCRTQVLKQEGHRLGVEPVLGVGTIEGDRRDAVGHRAGDGSAHFLPMPSSIEMTRSMTSSAPPPMETSRESRK